MSYNQSEELERRMKLNEIENRLEKLDKLEVIEEELGIDLITLFKALKNGVSDSNNEYSVHLEYKENRFLLLPVYEDMEMYAFDFKDYGKGLWHCLERN